MPIRDHVAKGSLLTCDFNTGFVPPEMTKKRLVVVLSPQIKSRPFLCTVVALSTSPPEKVMPYHAQIDIRPKLPHPKFESDGVWIKGDMVSAVGFQRLDLVRLSTRPDGSRVYYWNTLTNDQMAIVHKCVLHGMGLSNLTNYL